MNVYLYKFNMRVFTGDATTVQNSAAFDERLMTIV